MMTQRCIHVRRRTTAVLAFALSVTTVASTAFADTEQARAKITPWSGYWWPLSKGEILAPLEKYDSVVGSQAADWERKHNPSGDSVPRWFGYCHAWAASAIMEKEPLTEVSASHHTLAIGDQKGLLAVCHANDVANSFGDRFGDQHGSEDRNDLSPCQLWMLLKRHIREQGVPLIVDIEAGKEVWNYPVYAYKVEYAPTATGSNRYRGVISIWMADDAVPKDFVGVKRLLQRYRFEVTMVDGSVVMGSGRWLGTSQHDHPDFAWFPYVVRPENPEIKPHLVTRMLTPAAGEEQSPSQPPRADAVGDIAVESGPQPVLLDSFELVTLLASQTSAFDLDVTVDRFDGGVYQAGDLVSVVGRSQRDGYLYLLAIDPQGNPSLLYPQPQDDNRIQAGADFAIPSNNANYQFRLHQPLGDYRIKAIVCENQLEFSGLTVPEPQPSIRKPAPNTQADKATLNAALDRQGFRWNPTRRSQVCSLLLQYTTKGRLASNQLEGLDPATILGDFAQDEVVFYVGKQPPKATTH